ncbi:MAG: MFS transporter [Deltaproteobacteria bacterium]|nr:MFS transporter [Deltaproteobacteria bacterium]
METYKKPLLKDRRFWPSFWTQFAGAFNDNVFKNALVILITYKSYTLSSLTPEQMVALCGGLFIVPFFLFSALAGQLSDKFAKHKLMVWVKVGEICCMIVGAFGFYCESINLLLLTLFFMGTQSAFFGPVKYSVLPELVREEELVQGNALVELGTFLAILLGTITGGILIGVKVGALWVSVITIVIAILGTWTSWFVNPLPPRNPMLHIRYGLIKPTWEIIKIAKEVKSIWHSVLGISWFWFLGAALLSMFPIYVKDVLHADEKVVTLFLAMFSVGVGVGSMLCEKMSRERLELGLVPLGSIGMSFFVIDLFFVGKPSWALSEGPLFTLSQFVFFPSGWRILLDLLLFSVFAGFFIIPLYTFIQQRSETKIRSRVIAANNIINSLFMVGTSIVLAVLYGFGFNAIELFLFFGVLNILVAIYIYTVIPEFLLRFACVIMTRLVYRLEVKGIRNIPQEGPAVIVSNHVTFIDWLFIAAVVKRPVRFVMHYECANMPLLKFLFRNEKVIPIAGHKEDPHILEEALKKISIELSSGELVCIFPEGMITRIEKIIAQNPVPVIPLTLHGLSKPSVALKNIWRKVGIHINSPIHPQNVTAGSLEEMARASLKEVQESIQVS